MLALWADGSDRMHKLIIEDDEGRTTVVPLVRDELTIGRKEGNAIRLTERNISRTHARLSRKNGAIFIEDLGSYTGVRVNGRPHRGSQSGSRWRSGHDRRLQAVGARRGRGGGRAESRRRPSCRWAAHAGNAGGPARHRGGDLDRLGRDRPCARRRGSPLCERRRPDDSGADAGRAGIARRPAADAAGAAGRGDLGARREGVPDRSRVDGHRTDGGERHHRQPPVDLAAPREDRARR